MESTGNLKSFEVEGCCLKIKNKHTTNMIKAAENGNLSKKKARTIASMKKITLINKTILRLER